MKTNNPLLPVYFPESWAMAHGQDNYGLWQAVYLDEIEIRFRWMPPGWFMMGSPADELGRLTNEKPQHRVTFSDGFWLAETACSQAVWQAVMKKNPSQFSKDKQNPVEMVGGNNVLEFIKKINAHIPALALRIPSEAEWEYGCRAGTITPFWFGNELNTDRANYNGNYPYNNGEKGVNREKTVPVKSFQPNPWGLFQMHGNVCELCQNYWYDDYKRASLGGRLVSGADVGPFIPHGGSWGDPGSYLRSGFRSPWLIANNFIGFRLARDSEKIVHRGKR